LSFFCAHGKDNQVLVEHTNFPMKEIAIILLLALTGIVGYDDYQNRSSIAKMQQDITDLTTERD